MCTDVENVLVSLIQSNPHLVQDLPQTVLYVGQNQNGVTEVIQFTIEQTDSPSVEQELENTMNESDMFSEWIRKCAETLTQEEVTHILENFYWMINEIRMYPNSQVSDDEYGWMAIVVLGGFVIDDEFTFYGDTHEELLKKIASVLLCMESE